MKTAVVTIAPLLCLLAACSDEAQAPVQEEEPAIEAEMPPQPEINESMTEEEADTALEELEAEQRALESSAESESGEAAVDTDSGGE